MRKFLLTTAIAATVVSVANAQSEGTTVRGRLALPNGEAAQNVSIYIDNSANAEAVSDESGNFELEIPQGKHNLTFSHSENTKFEAYPINIKSTELISLGTVNLTEDSDGKLDEVVISTSNYKANKPSNSLRLDEALIDIPQNIQIITNKVLADQQITSLSDGVIRNVSGATRLEHWGDQYTRINMRGSRASEFRDGMNVTSNWGPLTADMSFVDHIEFVKGPAGFMMSNGEPSGIFNVVTKKPTGISKGSADIMFGSYDFYRAAFDLDGKLDKKGKVLYRLNLMGQTKNSFRTNEFNNRFTIAPVLSYKLSDRTTLTASYVLQSVRMSNIGSYYVFSTEGYAKYNRNTSLLPVGLDPTKVFDHTATVNLQHQINDDWKLTAQASYMYATTQGSSMWPTSVADGGKVIRNVSLADSRNVNKFGQVFLNGNIKTEPVNQRILAGLDLGDKEYLGDWTQSFALDSAGAPFDEANPNNGKPANGYPQFDRSRPLSERVGNGGLINLKYTGLYLQDELGFFHDQLRLTLAGRYTYANQNNYGVVTTAKKFTPRVGLSYSIDPSTAVYGLFDQTFVPTAGALRDGNSANPVTGNNIEFGVKRDWFGGKWNTTASVYRILKNNQTSADPLNTPAENYVVQFGQTKTQGVEFDLRGEILPGLSLIANYAFTDSKISKANSSSAAQLTIGNKVPGFAKHVANAWLSYEVKDGLLKGVGVSAGFSYQADRTTWTWTGATGLNALPNYFRLDGGLFYEVGKVRLTGNIFNITDKYLYSGAAYASYYYWQAEAGRNWRFGVTYKF